MCTFFLRCNNLHKPHFKQFSDKILKSSILRLLPRMLLTNAIVYMFYIQSIIAFDENDYLDGLYVIFTPPVAKKVKVSVEANFTVQFYCDQEFRESQLNCEK